MSDLRGLLELLTGGAEGARAQAREILDELRAGGHLDDAEAEALARGIESAVESHREMLEQRVIDPLRGVLRGAADALSRGIAERAGAAAPRSDSSQRPTSQGPTPQGPTPEWRTLLRRLEALEARVERLEVGSTAPEREPRES